MNDGRPGDADMAFGNAAKNITFDGTELKRDRAMTATEAVNSMRNLGQVAGCAISPTTVRDAIRSAIEYHQREVTRLMELRDSAHHTLLNLPLSKLREYVGAL